MSTGPDEPPEDWEDDGPTEPDWDLLNDMRREDRALAAEGLEEV